MKLLGSTASKITKDKNGENVPHLEVIELVSIHCNLVNNDYQQDSRILFTFAPNKTFDSLLKISPKNHVFLKTFNSEFQEVKITDQTNKPLEVEDRINVTLIIESDGLNVTFTECKSYHIKIRYSIELRERRHMNGYVFLSFARNIGTHATKVAKNMSNEYGGKLADTAKKSTANAIKTASKRAIQKTADATGDLVGNKIADKITSVSKKSHNEEMQSNGVNNEIPKERYISPKERQQIIDELRLI